MSNSLNILCWIVIGVLAVIALPFVALCIFSAIFLGIWKAYLLLFLVGVIFFVLIVGMAILRKRQEKY